MIPNQTGINSLLVFDMPVEFAFKLGKLPAHIFGDFGVNFDGASRARAAGHPDQTDQNLAYQIGAGIGVLKHKGDFSLNAYWQHVDQFALDPNLVDSDIFDSRVNIEGVYVQLGYAISDAVWNEFDLCPWLANRQQARHRRRGRSRNQSGEQLQPVSGRSEL